MQVMNRLASYSVSLRARMYLIGEGEAGQGLVEYALIISLVVVISIVVVILIGNQSKNMWVDIQQAVP
jgi:Flp pilus assembly pilin Flp